MTKLGNILEVTTFCLYGWWHMILYCDKRDCLRIRIFQVPWMIAQVVHSQTSMRSRI